VQVPFSPYQFASSPPLPFLLFPPPPRTQSIPIIVNFGSLLFFIPTIPFFMKFTSFFSAFLFLPFFNPPPWSVPPLFLKSYFPFFSSIKFPPPPAALSLCLICDFYPPPPSLSKVHCHPLSILPRNFPFLFFFFEGLS